jgi:hypothetical protein
MGRMKKFAWTLVVWPLACGSESDPTVVEVRDVRVAAPAPDPAYYDVIAPELTIQPGEEKMACFHLASPAEEIAIDFLDTEQGPFGHHVVMLSPKEPQPDGTLEDCTDAADMSKYRTLILPETEIPDGYAVRVPPRTPMVFQFHYVNTGLKPLLVRDYARLHKIPMADVTNWATTMGTTSARFRLPADGSEVIESFDCVIPHDIDVLVLGGHMHEHGAWMKIEMGNDAENLELMYNVEKWVADYRDAPPVELFLTNPRRVAAGSILRTTCAWKNLGDKELAYPEEMCAAFGYTAGSEEQIQCEVSAD